MPRTRKLASLPLAVTLMIAALVVSMLPAGATAEPAPPDAPAAAAEPATDVAVDAAAAAATVSIFDANLTHRADAYWQPSYSGPANLTSPVNYTRGQATLDLTVTSKPSSKPVRVQVCMWRAKFTIETCSRLHTLTDEGTYSFALGAPSGWWKKNGRWDWSARPEAVRIMIKDAATGKLMVSSKCGQACYRGSDLGQHVPITMRGRLTFSS